MTVVSSVWKSIRDPCTVEDPFAPGKWPAAVYPSTSRARGSCWITRQTERHPAARIAENRDRYRTRRASALSAEDFHPDDPDRPTRTRNKGGFSTPALNVKKVNDHAYVYMSCVFFIELINLVLL